MSSEFAQVLVGHQYTYLALRALQNFEPITLHCTTLLVILGQSSDLYGTGPCPRLLNVVGALIQTGVDVPVRV